MAASNRHAMSILTNHGNQMVMMNDPIPSNTTLADFKQWLCDLLQQGQPESFDRNTLSELALRSAELYRSLHHEPAGLLPSVRPSNVPSAGPYQQARHETAQVHHSRLHLVPPADPQHQPFEAIAPAKHVRQGVSFPPAIHMNNIQSSANALTTGLVHDYEEHPRKRALEFPDDSEDEDAGRTVFTKKQNFLSRRRKSSVVMMQKLKSSLLAIKCPSQWTPQP
jgi:hypothetical protein